METKVEKYEQEFGKSYTIIIIEFRTRNNKLNKNGMCMLGVGMDWRKKMVYGIIFDTLEYIEMTSFADFVRVAFFVY